MKAVMLLLLLSYSCTSFCQTKISGTVKQPDSSVLSYVNIGIKLKNIGTITGTTGQFQLNIPDQFLNDTLTFSYVGFKELNIPVQNIIKLANHVFVLIPASKQLAEVVVTGKQLKQKTIGTKSRNPFLSGAAQSLDSNDIIEFAKFIDINNKVSRIKSVTIYLMGVRIDTATFRINFYDVQNNLPGNKAILKNLVERMYIKKGWITVELSKENIVLNRNFFVGFEFIPEKKSPRYSLSYGGQVGGTYVTRESSLGRWQKGKGASLSAYVTLLQ